MRTINCSEVEQQNKYISYVEILAADDDPILLHTIQMVLEDDFGEVGTTTNPNRIEDLIDHHDIKVLILDLNFSKGDEDGKEGLIWIKKLKEKYPHLFIIILTAHGFLNIAVASLKQGADDFLEKPFSNEKMVATVKSALKISSTTSALNEANTQNALLSGELNKLGPVVFGRSQSMATLQKTIEKAAGTDASILITGEHGSGKEVMARLIHQSSSRFTQPLIHTDLGAITPSLFESTLFGHKKGSFTDAQQDRIGMMEMANFGSLLLDEIGELPLPLQSKLLSALQNRMITRIGEHRARPVDIRLITTTHFSEKELADETKFRQDLLYRVNTITIEIPPLRYRPEDIKPLALLFLEEFNRRYHKKVKLDKEDIKGFKKHHWPGNVRELKNTIEKMVIMGKSEGGINPNESVSDDNLYSVEKHKIQEILARHSGNISRAAQELGIGRNTLYRKLKKYGL